jgi:branched-subunit amino acid transport protein
MRLNLKNNVYTLFIYIMNIHTDLESYQFINEEPNFSTNLDEQFKFQDLTNIYKTINKKNNNENLLNGELTIVFFTDYDKYYLTHFDEKLINNLQILYKIIDIEIEIKNISIQSFNYVKDNFSNFLIKKLLYKELPTNSLELSVIEHNIITDIKSIEQFFIIQDKYSLQIDNNISNKNEPVKNDIKIFKPHVIKPHVIKPHVIKPQIIENNIVDNFKPLNFDSTNNSYYLISNDWTSQNIYNDIDIKFKPITFVLYNITTNKGIVVDFDVSNIDIVSDFIIIKKYLELGEEIYESLNKMFNNKEFLDKDDYEKKVLSFEVLYGFNIQTKNAYKEKTIIMNYLKENYDISEDINKRMKASTIIEYIQRDLFLDISNKLEFSKKVSQYLLELNLKKKRFSDGIYYYGIESKLKTTDGQNLEELFNKNMEERNNEIKQINNFYKKDNLDDKLDKVVKEREYVHKDKTIIMNYLKENFIISEDINKKMKASKIIEYIQRDLFLDIPNKLEFSKKVSQYLLELNLKEKIFPDGIYYYGIELKFTNGLGYECLYHMKELRLKKMEHKFNEKLKEREQF